MAFHLRAEPAAPIPMGYVTDGQRLLFVERVTSGRTAEPVVVAEDCRTLDILLFVASDFRRLRLRPVTTGNRRASAPPAPAVRGTEMLSAIVDQDAAGQRRQDRPHLNPQYERRPT